MSIVKDTIIEKLGFIRKTSKRFMSKIVKVLAVLYISVVSIMSVIIMNVPHQGGLSMLEDFGYESIIMFVLFVTLYYVSICKNEIEELNIKYGKMPTEYPFLYSLVSFKEKNLSDEDRLNLKKIKQETILNEIEYELIEREISIDGINNQHDYIKLLFKLYKHELLKECSEKK